jgi:hypothetical protein
MFVPLDILSRSIDTVHIVIQTYLPINLHLSVVDKLLVRIWSITFSCRKYRLYLFDFHSQD